MTRDVTSPALSSTGIQYCSRVCTPEGKVTVSSPTARRFCSRATFASSPDRLVMAKSWRLVVRILLSGIPLMVTYAALASVISRDGVAMSMGTGLFFSMNSSRRSSTLIFFSHSTSTSGGVPAGAGTPGVAAAIFDKAAFTASTSVVYSLPKCDASRVFTALLAAAPLSARARSSFNPRTRSAISSGELRPAGAGAPTNNAFRPGRCSVIPFPHPILLPLKNLFGAVHDTGTQAVPGTAAQICDHFFHVQPDDEFFFFLL